jgi:hydroxyethylthiazole kinase-like uncharacterized protein yjeF
MNKVAIPELPDRPAWAHKGTFGTCMILGGSLGMMGALVLAGRAALRSGVGLCRLAAPETLVPLLPACLPEATSLPLPEEGGAPSLASTPILLGALASVQALGIGPGLSQLGTAPTLVLGLLRRLTLPLVLDADALNALGPHPDAVRATAAPVILTPHPGEAASLLDYDKASLVQNDRNTAAKELALRSGAVIVLKGEGTIVQEPPDEHGDFAESRHYFNTSGNPGMGTAGSGDVLTGMLTALLAQGMSPFEAAVLGVHAHGLAGDLAAEEGSEVSLMASDLIGALPRVWKLLGSR